MTMLVGYFDDSGSHTESEVIVIGGFVATSLEWLGFESQWEAALKEFEIGMFRMSKWSNRAPPFDWPDEKRHACLARLINIIADRSLMSFGVALPMASYGKLLSPLAQQSISPYGLAAEFVFGAVAEEIRDADAKVAYIFESGSPGSSGMKEAFDKSMSVPSIKKEFHLASLTFLDKRNVLQLQAADIVAYEIYREFSRPSATKWRKPLQELIKRISRQWFTATDESIRQAGKSAEINAVLARTGLGFSRKRKRS